MALELGTSTEKYCILFVHVLSVIYMSYIYKHGLLTLKLELPNNNDRNPMVTAPFHHYLISLQFKRTEVACLRTCIWCVSIWQQTHMKSHSANTMTEGPGPFAEGEVVRLFETGWPINGFTSNTLATWPLLTSLHHVPKWTILITSSHLRLGRPSALPSSLGF